MLSPQMLITLGILFFVVSNPMMYEQVQQLLPQVADENGPTQVGVLLHAVVFLVLVVLANKAKLPAFVAKFLPKSA